MIQACTIIAGNYLAAARVLADSFFEQHPDGSFSVLVVDSAGGDDAREHCAAGAIDRRIEWWRLEDLELDRAEIHRLAGIYDVTELSTAVKPLFLQLLSRARGGATIYLDPDIRIFGSLAYAAELAEQHGLVLTPHLTQPVPDDGRGIDALFVLAAGVYNLGFAAVAPAAAGCLDWWWRQTRRRALNDVQQQMFTDQRWADFMPSLFRHHLLKDPGYNAAYWNLHERPLTRAYGRLLARNVPLRFFHFSGFDARMPWLLSRHQGERPRILLGEHPVLAELCEDYAAALGRAGFDESSRWPYGWRRTADGLEMTPRIRRLYWAAVVAAESGEIADPPDPFDAEEPRAFTDWLNAPDERGPRRWSRYVRAIYDARPDVRAHIPDVDGANYDRFGNWLRSDGVVQEHIPPRLLPAAPSADVATAIPSDAGPPAPPGLNVAGYFNAELGIGEAARLLTRGIAAAGIDYATISRTAPLSRQQHSFEGPPAGGGIPYDVHLLCVNADVTPAFAREAGPAFFDGRYTIGYWFWEVSPLPAAMHAAFDHVDEVWAATDYVADIVRAASGGRSPVFTVPLPLGLPAISRAFTRAHLGLPSDRFIFLFMFDFLSEMERKNPLGAIAAFRAAFAPGEGPLLVLKSINGDARIANLERLRHAAADRSDIVIRDGYVSADEKHALVAACDCYVSLHRAEGLGLTLAEAMALGKPVIATGYSGNRHFMTDANSFLVGYEVTTLASAYGPYPAGARWAEPDVSHAAQLMRAVHGHPDEAARRGERGRADVVFRHGVIPSAAAIAERLMEIRRGRAGVSHEPVSAGAPVPSSGSGVHAPTGVTSQAAALEAFTAALPYLRQLSELRLTRDERSAQWLRRAAQRVVFRLMRPYWFQRQQYEHALLDAVQRSLERLSTPGANEGNQTHD